MKQKTIRMIKFPFILMMIFSAIQCTFAACVISTSAGTPAKGMADGIGVLLSSSRNCPQDVFAFREQIKLAGLTMETTMVANRGFHNPSIGSFSFFEMVTGKLNSIDIQSGDFFFGHFTTVDENDELTADQGPNTTLMIEAFAWDVNKKMFNFYELIGNGKENQWFYRGDSRDIDADNALLHRQPDSSHPQFGSRLRCSACHGAGGPIMKEIHSPYNDWWEPNRKLDFGGRKLNQSIRDMVENLVPASRLAESVMSGIKKRESSKITSDIDTISLQEKLRPLFCPVEINFRSDTKPYEDKNTVIHIPIEFFINEKLIPNTMRSIAIARNDYDEILKKTGSHFPETTLSDADHAWLAPVKATSDQFAIDRLLQVGLIDEKFVSDVLSVDMTNPVFSSARCGLLKYVPNTKTDHWKNEFIHQLKLAHDDAAKELLDHLTNASHTPEYHQKKAMTFLMNCLEKVKNANQVEKLFLLLAQRRVEIKFSEISKNRLGQILEPRFRVIFPENDVKSMPGKLMLTDKCEVELTAMRN